MPTQRIDANDVAFEFSYSLLSGRETVSHGGLPLSNKRSYRESSLHKFEYPANTKPEWFFRSMGPLGWALWRDGTLINSQLSGWRPIAHVAIYVFVGSLLLDLFDRTSPLFPERWHWPLFALVVALSVWRTLYLRRRMLTPPGRFEDA